MQVDENTIVDIDLDLKGGVMPEKHDKKIIIDADTIVFASCSVCEYEVQVEEDGELITDFDIDLDNALQHAKGKLDLILDSIGGKEEHVELHFTGGKQSFRYHLLEDAFPDDIEMHYKHKRKKKKAPAGLHSLKIKMLEHYPGEIHWAYEADDIVVQRKKYLGDDAILCAVDKDVIKNTTGLHWNYYESNLYGIEMKWVDISEEEANYNQYLQVITGDKSDNVPGLHGIGPKKAEKFIELGMTEDELWDGVLAAYTRHCKYGEPLDMAILNMRLVNMHQLNTQGEIELWQQ